MAAKVNKAKASKMLEDGEINGKPLTSAQEHLFQMIVHGGEPKGAEEGALIAPSYPAYSHLVAAYDELTDGQTSPA